MYMIAIFVLMLVLIGAWWEVTFVSFTLMNRHNDLSVWIGLVILTCSFVLFPLLARQLNKLRRKSN